MDDPFWISDTAWVFTLSHWPIWFWRNCWSQLLEALILPLRTCYLNWCLVDADFSFMDQSRWSIRNTFWLGERNRCGDSARCPVYSKFIKRTKETRTLGQAIVLNHPFFWFAWNRTEDYRSTQDSWFGLLPLLIGLGSLPGASHLHSWQEVVSRRVRSWFVWEAFLSAKKGILGDSKSIWILVSKEGLMWNILKPRHHEPRPRYISGLHGVVVTSEFYGSMPRLLGPAGRGALSAVKCGFALTFLTRRDDLHTRRLNLHGICWVRFKSTSLAL